MLPVQSVLLTVGKKCSGVVESLCQSLPWIAGFGAAGAALECRMWCRVLASFCLCGVDGHGRGPTDFKGSFISTDTAKWHEKNLES